MRKKKREEGEQQTQASGDPRVAPEDVQRVEFRLAFRGYRERDVDAFLDRVTEDLSSYLEEIRQLRAGAPATAVAMPTAPTSSAEAAEVLASARAEAAEIVRRAETQAAAIRAAAGSAAAGDARTAVAPFLNKEREFLQSLGSLVQTHAEEIKQMVMAIRAREERPAPASAPPASAAVAAETPAPAEPEPEVEPEARMEPSSPAALEPASAAEIRERLEAAGAGETITIPDESDETPRAPAVASSATDPVFSSEAPPVERRERSLRELFWGED